METGPAVRMLCGGGRDGDLEGGEERRGPKEGRATLLLGLEELL